MLFRLEYVRCGKKGCGRCRARAAHGPYWYAYWTRPAKNGEWVDAGRTGKLAKMYIGKRLPPLRDVDRISVTAGPIAAEACVELKHPPPAKDWYSRWRAGTASPPAAAALGSSSSPARSRRRRK